MANRIRLIAITLISFSTVSATIINVPADIDSIQGGINLASNGDTVLVQPGSYIENINFYGKNIIVGSLFLITGESDYLTQTVIDGNSAGAVVIFENGEDSTAVLSGFTITNGTGERRGERETHFAGGGISIKDSNPTLSHLVIRGNNADRGGGISCDDSNPALSNLIIIGNKASRGGGISFENSNTALSNVLVTGNVGLSGGGIRFYNSSPVFDQINRCKIYSNRAASLGQDLYADGISTEIHVVVDSFTVMRPTDFHANPSTNFTFDILHATWDQVEADVYVSPDGNDANGGESPANPVKTIIQALTIILADSLHPRTVFLADGIYGPSTNGEYFPLPTLSYISLSGESREGVILNAEDLSGGPIVLEFSGTQGHMVSNLTIKGDGDAVVICDHSSPIISNITLNGCGIRLYESNPSVTNVTVRGNVGEAGILMYGSRPTLYRVTISDNDGWLVGGIRCEENSFATLANCTITRNTSMFYNTVGITCNDSSIVKIVNSIIWNESGIQILFSEGDNSPYSISIAHSTVRGGQNSYSGSPMPNERLNWLEGNSSHDPLFLDPTNGDFRLQAGSPCIDAGVQDTLFVFNDGSDTLLVPAIQYDGSAPDIGAYEYVAVTSSEDHFQLPIQVALHPAYPNPFNPVSTIRYDLPQGSDVSLIVYDILGREVAKLVDGYMEVGYHQVHWNGGEFASGIYIARLMTPDYSKSIKMLLLK